MKAWQATCIVGAIAFTGIISGWRKHAGRDRAERNAGSGERETPVAPALSAAVPELSARPVATLQAESGSVTSAIPDR